MDNTRTYLESPYEEDDCNLLGLTDGTLITEDGYSFPVHRFLLCWCNRYFSAKFCGAEEEIKDVLIPGIRGKVLGDILIYIYKKEIHLTDENIWDMFAASHFLSLENLISQTSTWMEERLSVTNCLPVYISARRTNSEDLLKKSYRFIQTHFEELVCNTDETIYEFPLDLFVQLLKDKNLRVQHEKIVWQAIVKWVEADLSNRDQHVPHLLMYLTDVGENLAADISKHSIVSKNPLCQMTDYLQSLQPRRPQSVYFFAPYRMFESPDEMDIYVTYDENIDLWRKITTANGPSNYITSGNGCIYLINTNDNSFIEYDPYSDRFSDFKHGSRIEGERSAVVELDEFLYVLGGYSTRREIDIYGVEMFNLDFEIWENTWPMYPAISPSAVTLNGVIYVVGKKPLLFDMIAQKYNPPTELWELLPKPSIVRCKNFTLTVYRNEIFLIGGKNGEENVRDVEVFNPSQNIWHTIQALPYTYRFTRSVVINDFLIVSEDPLQNDRPAKFPPVQWNNDAQLWETIKETSPLFYVHYYFVISRVIDHPRGIIRKNTLPTTVFEKSPFA